MPCLCTYSINLVQRKQLVKEFLIGDVKTFLYDNSQYIYESGEEPLHYTIFQETEDVFTGRVKTTGIARHPVQLYEAACYLLLFITMFVMWNKEKGHTPREGSQVYS